MYGGVRNQCRHKGILVGGFHSYDLSQDTRQKVAECCETGVHDVEESGNCCRSVWIPGHGYNGLLYREKERVIAIIPAGEIVAEIEDIFTVQVEGHSRAFFRAKKFEWSGNAINSDHRVVRQVNQHVVGELENVSRKVMLQTSPDDNNESLVIDFMRRRFPVTIGSVVVPYYPVINDMVSVRGANFDDVWKARVIAFNLAQKNFLGKFFIEEDGVWIPECGMQNQRISFRSILGVSSGIWLTEYDRWQES